MSLDPNHDPAAQAAEVDALSQPAPSSIGTAVGNVLRQPAFLVTASVLLLAAVFLNVAVGFMQLHFKKEPVPLAHELGTIPNRIGPWVQVSQDQPLDSEMQDVLGTDKYIFREYVNERIAGVGVQDTARELRESAENEHNPAERARLKKLSDDFIPGIRAKFPNAVVSLSVTYYTGMVDTVAHVPDRCVTADGYEPSSYETTNWPIARELPARYKADGDNIKLRFINFEDQTGRGNVPRSISYFFHVNGEFACSPLDVRSKLAELFERKAYYCKIETMTTMADSKESAQVQTDFLTGVMPEVIRCLPDWDKEHGRAPKAPAAAQVAAGS